MHCCTKLFRNSWDVECFISIPIYERLGRKDSLHRHKLARVPLETSQLVCYRNCIPWLHRLQVWNSSIHSLTKKTSRITCLSSTSKPPLVPWVPHGIIGFHHPFLSPFLWPLQSPGDYDTVCQARKASSHRNPPFLGLMTKLNHQPIQVVEWRLWQTEIMS